MKSTIVVIPRIGEYLPAGTPVFAVHGTGIDTDQQLLRHVSFDTERTYEQDVAFGFRELVDIAERALSPGVNDPTTAAQAIDILHDLLRRLAARPAPSGQRLDERGTVRLMVPRLPSSADLLDLAIRGSPAAARTTSRFPGTLRGMLADLHATARRENTPSIRRWQRAVAALGPSGGDRRAAGR